MSGSQSNINELNPAGVTGVGNRIPTGASNQQYQQEGQRRNANNNNYHLGYNFGANDQVGNEMGSIGSGIDQWYPGRQLSAAQQQQLVAAYAVAFLEGQNTPLSFTNWQSLDQQNQAQQILQGISNNNNQQLQQGHSNNGASSLPNNFLQNNLLATAQSFTGLLFNPSAQQMLLNTRENGAGGLSNPFLSHSMPLQLPIGLAGNRTNDSSSIDPKQKQDNPPSKAPSLAGKKRKKKREKDRPKRPLSAYNWFFKHERARILSGINDA